MQTNGAVVTVQQLLSYAREAAPDRDFPTVSIDTAQAEKEGWAMYESGQRDAAVYGKFLARANTLAGLMEPIDNELLEVRIMTDDEIRHEVVKRLDSYDGQQV